MKKLHWTITIGGLDQYMEDAATAVENTFDHSRVGKSSKIVSYIDAAATAVEKAICRLNPPVYASTSMTSPAK